MGVPRWAYTMITKALEVTKNCGSNRNVKNEGVGRRKTTPTHPRTLCPKT